MSVNHSVAKSQGNQKPVLEADALSRYYKVQESGFFKKTGVVKALQSASFSLHKGQTLAVVGESGCGKSTLARLVSMIESPTSGEFFINGEKVDKDNGKHRHLVQIVFQNPFGSLNPRQKIGYIIEEPLLLNTKYSASQREEKSRQFLEKVGLRQEHYDRYPHMFSGGQRQRIAIARALILNPKVLILDEPVSALDLSIQAQVLNILSDLQSEFGLAYLFISHDLSVVKHIADDIMVMYLGQVIEKGKAQDVFSSPRHPYTRALLSATPVADPSRKRNRIVLKGELPSPLNPPSGCAFSPRCSYAKSNCYRDAPLLSEQSGRGQACFYPILDE